MRSLGAFNKPGKQNVDVALNVAPSAGQKPGGLSFFRKFSSGSLSVFTSSPQRTRPPSPRPDVADHDDVAMAAKEDSDDDPPKFSMDEDDLEDAERRSEIDERIWCLAQPSHFVVDEAAGLYAVAVNFQACQKSKTQDRYAMQQFDINGVKWTFTGVFDGELIVFSLRNRWVQQLVQVIWATRLPITPRTICLSSCANSSRRTTRTT